MPISKVADRATVNGNATATTFDFALTGLTVGNVLIIRSSADNSGSSGAARTVTVTNQSGTPINLTTDVQYQRLQDPGAASAGLTLTVCVAVITATSGTVRLTYSGSVVQAGVAEEWTGIDTAFAGSAIGVIGTPVTAVGTASTNLASTAEFINLGNMAYAATGIEGPAGDTYTNDSDTTFGTWTALTKAGTTNATADANQTVAGAYKIPSTQGTQTHNPTNSVARDSAGIILHFATTDRIIAVGSIATTSTIGVAAIPRQSPLDPTGAEDVSPHVVPFINNRYAVIWQSSDTDNLAAPKFQLWGATADETGLFPVGSAILGSSGLGMERENKWSWRMSDSQVAYMHQRFDGGSNIGTIYSGVLYYDSAADTMAAGAGYGANTFQPVGPTTGGTLAMSGGRMTDSKALLVAVQATSAGPTYQMRMRAATLASSSTQSWTLGTTVDFNLPGVNGVFSVYVVGISDTRAVILCIGGNGGTDQNVYGQLVTCTSGSGTTVATSGTWVALNDGYMWDNADDKYVPTYLDGTRFLLTYGEQNSSGGTTRSLMARIIDTVGDTFTLGTATTIDTGTTALQGSFVVYNSTVKWANDDVLISGYRSGAAATTYQTQASASGGSLSSIPINKPASTVEGNALYAFIALSADTGRTSITPPDSTWVQGPVSINSGNVGIRSFYKMAGASEPASYTFTFSAVHDAVGSISRVQHSLFDYAPPVVTINSGSGANPVVPTNNSLYVTFAVVAESPGVTHTPPTNFTEIMDTTSGAVNLSVAYDNTVTSGGAGGTFTSASTNWATMHFAVPTSATGQFGYLLDVGDSGTTVRKVSAPIQFWPAPYGRFANLTPNQFWATTQNTNHRIIYASTILTYNSATGTVERFGFLDLAFPGAPPPSPHIRRLQPMLVR